MKLIFLDIDGVLNSTRWQGTKPVRGFVPPAKAEEAWAEERIDPACLARLRTIVQATNASMVLMSSWRHKMHHEEFSRLLGLYGWDAAPVIASTPDLPRAPRGEEVAAWLKGLGPPAPRYVCLDDGLDFNEEQPCVFTNPDLGLTDLDALSCIQILNDKPMLSVCA